MGTPIDPPIIVPPGGPGDDCSICWGREKPFGEVETPDHIYLNFSGIQKSLTWSIGDPEPLDGLVVIPQSAGQPCIFSDIIDGVGYELVFLPGSTMIKAEYIPGIDMFYALTSSACEIFAFNESTGIFENGSCMIIIPEVV